MEGDEVVTLDSRAPARVDLRNNAALELEGRVGRVVGVGGIAIARFVEALGDVCHAEARHGSNLAKQIIEHIAPVAQHIEDDAAAFRLAVVPARPLDRLQVALEHPIAELTAHREEAPEEA